MTTQKQNLGRYLDALIDKDGLKTEVTITLTDQTMTKIITALLLSGVAIVVIAGLLKNLFPNAQLQTITKELTHIKQHLN